MTQMSAPLYGPNPANLNLEAYADNWSQVEEHDKYPQQTSSIITLKGGVQYYFELIYIENNGGDHISLYWKTVHEDPNEWTLINSNYISDVGCLPNSCPEAGTSCDDGNANTINDIEDGHCHCIGTAITTNNCIGDRHLLTAYAFDSIPGNSLNDLYADQDFPGTPHRSEVLSFFTLPNQSEVDSTGTLIQAYLTVPVTGDYTFNLTGNNNCTLFLSSDEDPANKTDTELTVSGSTGSVEHDKYTTQTSSTLSLTANTYYYIELNHKEGSYSEHFSLFWQTPFTEDGVWKRVPNTYFYDYDCEIACIPQGALCDDGNPYTNNDAYDNNCNCVGTPCSGSDCNDPLVSYTPYEKCNTTDQLDNRADNNWLSCNLTANPNTQRAASHWIQYDLGKEYLLEQTHVWNYNENSATHQGMEIVAIDYSIDGQYWTALDVYNWELADGSSDYSGFIGPDFGSVLARYVLITSLDSGSGCRGLGKMVFNASFCANRGASCNDNDPNTVLDYIDENCNCVGISGENPCAVDTLSLGDTLLYTNLYTAEDLITSANAINEESAIVYTSGKEIDILEGFEIPLGTSLLARIEPCTSTTILASSEDPKNSAVLKKIQDVLKVIPTTDPEYQLIQFYVPKPGSYRMDIIQDDGEESFHLFEIEFLNKGFYQKRIRMKKLGSKKYSVKYTSTEFIESESLVKEEASN